MYLVNWEFFLQLPFMQRPGEQSTKCLSFPVLELWYFSPATADLCFYVMYTEHKWCISRIANKRKNKSEFPRTECKAECFPAKGCEAEMWQCWCRDPKFQLWRHSGLVWCMVSLHIIESVPGLLSTFPLHSCMQYRDCRQCRQGRFSLIAYCWICHVVMVISNGNVSFSPFAS